MQEISITSGVEGRAEMMDIIMVEDLMKFIVNLERDETGTIVAECPAVRGCVSQGQTEQEALENIREAMAGCLEARQANGLSLISWWDKRSAGL